MRLAGIIAEYNPFHEGHRFHIEKTREAGATHIAVVMSGSVVQRGDIACMSAHDRAEAAIKGGADLVLELPPQYSLSPARDFARAGVDILNRLGCVDMLSFGAEDADVAALKSALCEIEDAELQIKAQMSAGKTYPQAAAEVLGGEASEIISKPNNTLAIEYLRALKRTDIEPFAVTRTVPHDGEETLGRFASASQIRAMLKCGESAEKFLGYQPDSPLSFLENGEKAVLYRLAMMDKNDFARVPYCGELAGRLYQATRRAKSLAEVYENVKSRNFTHSRVRRAVMLAALGVAENDIQDPPFARVLAMNKRGMEVLKACRETASIALNDSLKELSKLSHEAERQADIIELASRLQSLCRADGAAGVSEYRRSAVVCKGD